MAQIWILAAAAGIIAVLFAYMRLEAGNVETVVVDLADGCKVPGLTAVLLTDIHIGRLFVKPEKVKAVISEYKPDVLFLAGDYIEYGRDASRFIQFLDDIRCGLPVFMCFGNHDYVAFKKDKSGLHAFSAMITGISGNINILDNKTASFVKNGFRYEITGIADYREGCPDIRKAFEGRRPDAAYRIAVTHNPEMALSMSGDDIDCMLCGHFHGGQVWLPFNMEFRTMRMETISKMGIKKGLHELNGFHLYISRGLGNVTLPVRFLSRPEITVLKFPAYPEKDDMERYNAI